MRLHGYFLFAMLGCSAAQCQTPNCDFRQYKPAAGHTEWADGQVHQSGFTTAWTPNRKTPRQRMRGTLPDDGLCRAGRSLRLSSRCP